MGRRLIIGVGNALRSDDGAGPVVLRHLAGQVADVELRAASGEGAALMDLWQDAEEVFLVDATSSGAAPGTICRLEAHAQTIPASLFHYSTHDFSVAQAVEMARVLNQLPPRMIIYGIEGAVFDFGEGLTPAVAQAAQEVAERIRQEATCTSSP